MEINKIKSKSNYNTEFFLGWSAIFLMLILCSVWLCYIFLEQDKNKQIEVLHKQLDVLESQNIALEFELSKYKFDSHRKEHE